MNEPRRRLIEQVLDPGYLEGLGSRSIEDLKAMRDECGVVENEVSFERRLCQARIDILSAELDHRAGKVEGDLISRLPQILADQTAGSGSTSGSPPTSPPTSPLPSRPPDLSTPRSADVPRRRVDEIVGEQSLARLMEMDEDEIRSSLEQLAEHERNLSARRKRVHEVMDELQAEIIRRYTSGEADPSSFLT